MDTFLNFPQPHEVQLSPCFPLLFVYKTHGRSKLSIEFIHTPSSHYHILGLSFSFFSILYQLESSLVKSLILSSICSENTLSFEYHFLRSRLIFLSQCPYHPQDSLINSISLENFRLVYEFSMNTINNYDQQSINHMLK